MSGQAESEPRPVAPEPEFAVTGAAHRAFAAAPTMVFSTTAVDAAEHPIQTLALSVLVMIDPSRRGYDEETRVRLSELFGPPASWTPSTQGLVWARVATVVPRFRGTTAFELEIPCTYDLEIAATKYFYVLSGGDVPLSFHFSGTVFFHAPDGRLQVTPVSWSSTARFDMPVSAWRDMIAEHYPSGGWIRLGHATLAALNDRRAARGLPSFDACLEELLTDVADA
ncbi:MAG TPA: DUF6084 family protein [Solirubrobacteraceae bacterium]|nr:DUF6084 family protein [Solirubrobacteraceae bacterium]